METIDQEQQWRELKETYDRMTEGELCRVADEAFDLTPVAREALQAVISERGLNIPLVMAPLLPEPSGETDNPDDALISVRKLWSETEAKRAKAILEANFIASCLGPENIVDLEDFKASFDGGVDLKVFASDSRRAENVMVLYAPQEEETVEDLEEEGKKYAIVCPKCRSEEIVFEGEDPHGKNPTLTETQYNWTCDSCGHQWKDDGIAQIV